MKRLRLSCLVLLLASTTSDAQTARGSLRLAESAIDEFAMRLGPISVEQQLPINIPFCDGKAHAQILPPLTSRIRTTESTLGGNFIASLCGAAVTGTFKIPMRLTYDPRAQAARLRFPTETLSVNVRLPDLIGDIMRRDYYPLEIRVDMGAVLGRIPPIPLRATELTVNTARGARKLVLVGDNVQITHRYRYIELSGDLAIR
jgi:hypothetical protein